MRWLLSVRQWPEKGGKGKIKERPRALHRDHMAAGTWGRFRTALEVSTWSSKKREQFVLKGFKSKFLLSPLSKWWDMACEYRNINRLNGPAEVPSPKHCEQCICQRYCRGKWAKQQCPKSRVKKVILSLVTEADPMQDVGSMWNVPRDSLNPPSFPLLVFYCTLLSQAQGAVVRIGPFFHGAWRKTELL